MKPSKREISGYFYWYEFLKRSNEYLDVCNLVESFSDYKIIHELIRYLSPKNKMCTDRYFCWIYNNISSERLGKVWFKEEGLSLYQVLSRIYPLFQDVHTNGFDEVVSRVKLMYYEVKSSEIYNISMGYESLVSSMYDLNTFFELQRGRKLYADEFIELYRENRSVGNTEVFEVDTTRVNRNQCIEEFKKKLKYIKFSKKKILYPHMKYSFEAFVIEGKIHQSSFDEILRLYDLFLLHGRKEAIVRYYNNYPIEIEELEPEFDRLLSQARTLISNAKSGCFPGKWSRKKAQSEGVF